MQITEKEIKESKSKLTIPFDQFVMKHYFFENGYTKIFYTEENKIIAKEDIDRFGTSIFLKDCGEFYQIDIKGKNRI